MSGEAKVRGEACKKKARLCGLGGSQSKRWRRSTSTGRREEWGTPVRVGEGLAAGQGEGRLWERESHALKQMPVVQTGNGTTATCPYYAPILALAPL